MSSASGSEDLPFHLQGNYAPVTREVTATDLPVEGTIPPELVGTYYRNGPNPRSGESPHWFLGDGMVHGVHLERGSARWYRNRYVQTRYLTEGEEEVVFVDDQGRIDRTAGKANTNIVGHAGKLFALVENAFPTQLTRELDTVGPHDFGGRLTTAVTAHPKLCPTSGEMHFFGYSFAPPFLTYHVADAAGELVKSVEIPVPGPTMVHDFAITDRHVLFMDLPVVFSGERLLEGGMPYGWSDEYGARLGVMPRGGSAEDLFWFEIEPCYVFHPMNAFSDGNQVVLDVARYPELWRKSAADFRTASLHRFTLDLSAGSVKEEGLDDRGIEFPRIDPRVEGLAHRFGYAVRFASAVNEPALPLLIQYDLTGGGVREHDFGPGRAPGEAVFVPASDTAAEDEGWVLTLVYDRGRNASELAILDASRFDAPPVAMVKLPQRVPFGFHGNWVPL
jgi:carotenoid cleavage dioxygenase